jgi:hypothetical protein
MVTNTRLAAAEMVKYSATLHICTCVYVLVLLYHLLTLFGPYFENPQQLWLIASSEF